MALVIRTAQFADGGDRPRQNLSAKIEEFGCVLDLVWIRRSLGSRIPDASGRIAWRRNGIEQASLRYVLEADGLRLSYVKRSTGMAVVKQLPITTTGDRQFLSATWATATPILHWSG